MVTYVIVSTIAAFLTGWVWYQYIFPQAAGERVGGEGGAQPMQNRNRALGVVAFIILSVATGIFIRNRNIADAVDMVKLAIKIWFGFLFPVVLVAWAHSRASMNALIAHAGFWLVLSVEFAVLARWLLLG